MKHLLKCAIQLPDRMQKCAESVPSSPHLSQYSIEYASLKKYLHLAAIFVLTSDAAVLKLTPA